MSAEETKEDVSQLEKYCAYVIEHDSEVEPDGLHATAYCPLCEHKDSSHDHGYGEKHATVLSLMKIRMHLRTIHSLEAN